MNSEVFRLRKLRRAVLKVRALAEVLRGSESRDSLFARSGLLCWRIARVASGQLRGHPYSSYQKGPSFSHAVVDGVASILTGVVASKRGRGCQVFLEHLEVAARELDDVRALTLTPDLSDALGRAQWDMRILIEEFLVRAGIQDSVAESRAQMSPPQTTATPHSPYLAL